MAFSSHTPQLITRKAKRAYDHLQLLCICLMECSCRQMNTDYSTSCLIEGLSAETHKILIAYDIMCEYIVNLKTRLAEGPYLTNRAIDIEAAVGKFHLGAHIRECFAKFSPNFIMGAGQLDGEILETLWATLEKLASNTRSMSPAHRQEVLDLLMNDMNWKKIIQLGG